jgi:hypothetical protein
MERIGWIFEPFQRSIGQKLDTQKLDTDIIRNQLRSSRFYCKTIPITQYYFTNNT